MTQTTTEPPALVALSAEGVEAYSRRRGEPDWLRLARLAAWERYEALPVPTVRDKGWRRTDLAGLDLDRLAAPSDGTTAESDADLSTLVDESTGFLILRNGQVDRVRLDEQLVRRGVLVMSLAEAVRERPELVRDHLSRRQVSPTESKLDALAAALWNDGALVYIPRGVDVEAPIQVVHWADAPGAALTMTLVVAEEASSATIVNSYASPVDRPESLAAGEVYVVTRQASRVSVVNVQERDEQSWSFMGLRSEQHRDSALTWLTLELGGRLSRNELICSLLGQGAEADLLGMVFGEQSQCFDLQSLQDHVGSDTRSDLVHKVALRDTAVSNFTGLIRVGLEARRTASNQESRNLLLDPGTRADSDPNLEILNSDVNRCGHGAAVGPVDEEMIFYLQSRGLPHDDAERLIVEGFFAPLLARVPLESVRERLWAAIHRKLA
jgi:Fe-S cluster assembly protein SufD